MHELYDVAPAAWSALLYLGTVTNAAGQSQYSQYDFSSGLPVAVSNLNGAYTTFKYSDPLNRLTSVARPDGGNSNIYYENPTWTVYCQDKNSANNCGYTSQSFSDGLGRAIEQRTFEDGSNYISTGTTYDALGRVHTQTNPSRVTNGRRMGWVIQRLTRTMPQGERPKCKPWMDRAPPRPTTGRL